jgi:hypothetical protein
MRSIPSRPHGRTRAEELLDDIRREFPSFDVQRKRSSDLQRGIALFLRIVTFGAMRTYLTEYHTVLFGTLWVPDSWESLEDDDRYILLRHERVHLRQRKRLGDVLMAFVYLVPFFPLGLAYGRARLEWEAYMETVRATYEVKGLERARLLRRHIVDRFVRADYGWMWPFRRSVEGWFDELIADIEATAADSPDGFD